jgi:hypothetical protein
MPAKCIALACTDNTIVLKPDLYRKHTDITNPTRRPFLVYGNNHNLRVGRKRIGVFINKSITVAANPGIRKQFEQPPCPL